ncbi:MAG: heavy-metal-associated domain-containing protein [Sphingobacteriaceae bacterium]
MNTYKFKTTINCGGCVATVTPHLNGEPNIKNWQVDTDNPEKILTVEAENIQPEDVKALVEKLGFKAEPIS